MTAARPLTHAEHLAEYVLERLAEGLTRADALEGALHRDTRQAALHLALQRLMGAHAGDAYESRLVALLELPHDYLIGQHCRSIAEARLCAAADLAAMQPQPAQVPA